MTMIALLLLGLASLSAAADPTEPSDELTGKWKVLSDDGTPCIMVNAQIDLTLSYIKEDDSLADASTITVPVDSTTAFSSCYEKNEGWNVRLAFTEESKLEIIPGDYALFQVSITANYSAMPGVFPDVKEGHIHTYYSKVSFLNPPLLSDNEYTKVGYCIFCPDAQEFIINEDPHNGPTASIRLSNLQMQAYMTEEDFGRKDTCSDDQKDLDMVPVVCSCVLLGLSLFTLASYFVYRARLPTNILEMTEQEFGEEDDEHHHHKEHDELNGHSNGGFHEERHSSNGFHEENGHI